MANTQLQQARVLFLDGQTIILQNESGENAFNDLSSEYLHQALQSVGATHGIDDSVSDVAQSSDANYVVSTSAGLGVADEALSQNLETSSASNFRLIFQNDEESQGAVRFMTDHAEALGLKILVDSEVKEEQHQEAHSVKEECVSVNNIEQQHAQDGQQQVLFTTHSEDVTAGVPSFDDSEERGCDGLNENYQSAAEALGALVGATTAEETVDRPVRIIPQLIDGCVSYAVQFADGDESMDVPVNSSQDATAVDNSCSYSETSDFSVSVTTASETQQQQETSCPTVFSCIREFNTSRTPVKTQIPSRPHVPARKILSSQTTPASSSSRIKVHVVGGKVVSQQQPEVVLSPTPNLACVPVTNFNATKPLGSSENPIQLVQHGKTFHSVQALTQEQLKQIATVLQQRSLETMPYTKNVIYDAETNTRIIYRVVYPEELALRDANSSSVKENGTRQIQSTSVLRSSQNSLSISRIVEAGRLQHITTARRGRGNGRRGRPPGPNTKRSATLGGLSPEPADIRTIHDDAEEAAKTERKKQLLSRTRSGRLSRPPRHMIKDYKRLHRLDFGDADLDDSDGGYSDYQMSDHEEGKVIENMIPSSTEAMPPSGEGNQPPTEENPPPTEIIPPTTEGTDSALTTGFPTVPVPKRKISPHFRCPGCQKIYLGHNRMARHLQAFPEHNIKSSTSDNVTLAESSVAEAKESTKDTTEGEAIVPIPVPEVPNGAVPTVVGRVGAPPGRRKKGKRRGPWAYLTPEARSQRRKQKLQEVLTTCEPIEVAEVCGRTVCGALSLLDLLWLRLETLCANRLLEELATLLGETRTLLGSALTKDESGDELGSSLDDEHVEVCGDVLCVAMGLECGRYRVDSSKLRPPPQPPDPSVDAVVNGSAEKVQQVSEADSLVSDEPELKKPKREDVKLEASTSPDSGTGSAGIDGSAAGTPADVMALDDVTGDISSSTDIMDCDTGELQQCPLEALGLRAQPTILRTVKTPDSGISHSKEDSSPTVVEQPHTPATPNSAAELPVAPPSAELPLRLAPLESLVSKSSSQCQAFKTAAQSPVSHSPADLPVPHRTGEFSETDKPVQLPESCGQDELQVARAPLVVSLPHTADGLASPHTSVSMSVCHTQTSLILSHKHTKVLLPCTPVETTVPHTATELQVSNTSTDLSLTDTQADLSLPHTSTQLPLSSTPSELQLHHTTPELSMSHTSAEMTHHTSTEQLSVSLQSGNPSGEVTEDLHHSASHPLDEDLLDGLCCSTEGHPDVTGAEEDPGRQAALKAVDDIVRERLGLVDFLDDIPPPPPPPSPSTRVKLPGFESLQIPHRPGGTSVIPVPSAPTFLPLPDLSDHIDLDVLGEELAAVPAVASSEVGGNNESVDS